MSIFWLGDGTRIELEDRELASGGEGKIYRVKGHPTIVAKLYHPDKLTLAKKAKLQIMIKYPPRQGNDGHISIAWPKKLIYDAQKRFCGFTMPYIHHQDSFPLFKLYNPQDRRAINLAFTWKYLLLMASNLAMIITDLHDRGYVVGDLNESNLLVTSRAQVTLVDCDSLQVPKVPAKRRRKFSWLKNLPVFRLILLAPHASLPIVRLVLPARGRTASQTKNTSVFLCPVGKADYTPPELQGCDFSKTPRKPEHDNFSLAILIFLLLMEGRHPFTGVWQGNGSPLTLAQSIKGGYFSCTSRKLIPPKYAVPFDILPPNIQKLMKKCFNRPSLARNPFLAIASLLSLFTLGAILTLYAIFNIYITIILCVILLSGFTLLYTSERPPAKMWQNALKEMYQHLETCTRNPSHVYSNHLDLCPWCERVSLGIPDPFPQSTLATNTGKPPLLRSKSKFKPGGFVQKILDAVQPLIYVGFIFLFLAMYWAAISIWKTLFPILDHTAPQLNCVSGIVLLLTPILFMFMILRLYKRSR
jgi:DNA-binding helix-hairpin-helix protein with protein kinase domain